MALTIGKSPLAKPPGGAFGRSPKRIRGVLSAETVVDTRARLTLLLLRHEAYITDTRELGRIEHAHDELILDTRIGI